MNLVILFESDFIAEDTVRLTDRRLRHLLAIKKVAPGDDLSVGLLNNKIGTARVTQCTTESVDMKVVLKKSPPAPLPVTLIVGLPRPKMLKRIVQHIASMGVKEIHFINSYKVEKSFWLSPLLQSEKLQENLLLGLEQAQDTQLPKIGLHKLFKPFVEDTLPSLSNGSTRLVAHPGVEMPVPSELTDNTTLVVGPEGGFIPYEIDKLIEQGFTPFHMGSRILRVETAIPALLGKLFPYY